MKRTLRIGDIVIFRNDAEGFILFIVYEFKHGLFWTKMLKNCGYDPWSGLVMDDLPLLENVEYEILNF